MSKEFTTLINDIRNCRDCRDRFGFEPNPVFSGNECAKILQVSQAPSQNVHNTSKCFNDASGRKLRGEWYQISDDVFYDDDNFYISGVSHCFPGKNKNSGDNKPPKYCADKWLRKEVELVKCKLIVLLGRESAKYFFPKEEFSNLIFSNQEINGITTLVLPHPSPLNQKWFKDHPEFEVTRLLEIRELVHKTLFD